MCTIFLPIDICVSIPNYFLAYIHACHFHVVDFVKSVNISSENEFAAQDTVFLCTAEHSTGKKMFS